MGIGLKRHLDEPIPLPPKNSHLARVVVVVRRTHLAEGGETSLEKRLRDHAKTVIGKVGVALAGQAHGLGDPCKRADLSTG